MGRLEGKVALISGAGRGQGRSHAVRFAQEGASIIGFDLCAPVPSAPYDLATPGDLEETARVVSRAGGTVHTGIADVRDLAQVEAIVREGEREIGPIDTVLANAAIVHSGGPAWSIDEAAFRDVLDINLIGVWNTIRAVVPRMIERARPGCIIATASGAAKKGVPNIGAYVASKSGVLGLMHTLARELAPYGIRVNSVLPGNTNTPMMNNRASRRLYVPESDDPTEEQFAARARRGVPLGVPWVEPADISEAMVYLASDEAHLVTGVELPVDGGGLAT